MPDYYVGTWEGIDTHIGSPIFYRLVLNKDGSGTYLFETAKEDAGRFISKEIPLTSVVVREGYVEASALFKGKENNEQIKLIVPKSYFEDKTTVFTLMYLHGDKAADPVTIEMYRQRGASIFRSLKNRSGSANNSNQQGPAAGTR